MANGDVCATPFATGAIRRSLNYHSPFAKLIVSRELNVAPRRHDRHNHAGQHVEERHGHDDKEGRGRKGRVQQEFHQADDEHEH